MRFLGRSLTGLFLLAVTIGLLAWAGGVIVSAIEARKSREAHVMAPRERVFSVAVVKAEPRDIAPMIETFGELRSLRQLDLRATSSGRIIYLAGEFEEGGKVRAGQRLAQIDPAEARSALENARAGLEEAEAERKSAEAALALAKRDLGLAEAQAELRARALARQRDLLARGVGTDAAVEAAELADQAARQVVLSRRQAVQQAESRLARARIALKRADNALADARRRLADTTISAPFAGRLEEVSAIEGGVVQKNERLARLIDPAAIEVAFSVSTAQYARLLGSSGALAPLPVEVWLESGASEDPLAIARGTLGRESTTTGEGRTGRQLFARLEGAAEAGMRPGDFVRVRLFEPVLKDVVKLPAQALGPDGGVLVLDGGNRLEALPVKLLRRQGNDVIIRAPALAGRLVVAHRTPLLGAGIRVNPLRSDVEGGPAGGGAGERGTALAGESPGKGG